MCIRDRGKHATRAGRPRALVLVPTRELAVQVEESMRTYGRHSGCRTAVLYGGVGQGAQVRALQGGVDVVVATPGRLLDLIQQGHCSLGDVQVLVLDEADRMLDMGFIRPIRQLASMAPPSRQTMLFSATMPKEIRSLAEALMRDPVRVEVTPVASAAPRIEQRVHRVPRELKQALLERLLEAGDLASVVVFTRTKHGADRVMRRLVRAQVDAAAIHGNRNQSQRQRALDGFRSGRIRVLVATDVASRGIDVDGVSHVINYDVPVDAESYVHRIGRTGRAGAAGKAITFCEPAERGALAAIERLIGRAVPESPLPEGLAAAAAAAGRQEPGRTALPAPRRDARAAAPKRKKQQRKPAPAAAASPAAARAAAPAAHPRAHAFPAARHPARKRR